MKFVSELISFLLVNYPVSELPLFCLKTVEAALFAICLSVCLTASLDSHVMTQSPKALLLELPVQKLCSEYSSRSVA